MRELELNTIMGVIADPEKSALDITDKRLVADIERIIRVFAINKEQNNKHRMFAIKNMVTMRLVLSNN